MGEKQYVLSNLAIDSTKKAPVSPKADSKVITEPDWSSRIKMASTILSASTYIPLLAIDLSYTKPFRRITNTNISGSAAAELRVMADAADAFKKIGRGLGALSLGISAIDMAYQSHTKGRIKTSTKIDFAISSFLYAGSFVTGPAAPFFWAGAALYSGIRLFGGDAIDNWIDDKK